MTINLGSQWRKWNFHVHTKGTNKNDQFTSSSPEDFFYIFFKAAFENKVEAIGITDYISIDRYIEAVVYVSDIENKENVIGEKLFTDEEITFVKGIFLFPNVELRMLPATDRGRLINIHCLFNPEYVPHLENDFFGHIENQDGKKMNRHGLIDYGRELDSSLTTYEQRYKKGIDSFVIDLKTLKSVLNKNKNFRDNCILVVSNSNNDGASAVQKHYNLFENEEGSLDGLRSSIYKISHAIFSTNIKDINYFLGKRLEGTDGYNEEIYKQEVGDVTRQRGSLKSCLVGCDSHKESTLFSKFTWVKGDLTFEGLRQICFEPEQRVKIQEDKPDFKEEKLLIEKVKFISPNNVFSTVPIYLNPNLNVIIGGKSSGKSILLFSIAKTLSADETVLKNENGSYKYDLNVIEDGFDFEITTKGGFSQRLNRNADENSILPQIKYIPQNYLVKLAEPELNKKGKSLNKIVRDLIIEDDESRELYQSFLNKVTQNDKLRNSQIDSYFEAQKEIQNLEEELKTKSNKSVLEKNIETNTEKLEELNKSNGLTPEQVEEYKALQSKQEENKGQLQKFREDFSAVENFNQDLAQVLKNLKQKKNSLLENLQLQKIKDYYQSIYTPIDSLLEEVVKIEKSLDVESTEEGKRVFKEEKGKFQEVLTVISDEGKKLSDAIQPFLKDDQIKKAIEALNQSISSDKKALLDIENLNKKIQDKKKQLNDSKEEIFKIYENSYREYIAIIEVLKNRTIELEKDGLKILGKSQFHYNKLRKGLLDVSDGRSSSYRQYNILEESKKSTDEAIFTDIFKQIKTLFENIISGEYVLNSRASISNTIKILMDDYFFDYWEITYKKDKLGEMSTGKASFVILMLIIGLSKSKAPILIDQPEDNLDNRSITADLVNYLRNKKLERQIIVVTHNANIVVNADAENVIVANQKGQNDDKTSSLFKFDYINGSIENSFDKLPDETDLLKSVGIRQHIADIVEGGKDAFIMREKKYRFH